MKNKKLH